ncbi:(S)-benzoin forming benzil reductase [Paenibacillus hexagrammi]|uniref:(S)-benzoin forming benzil reductase n=1 Tax=Paenibacillus hexagrammi TaxID=2908839 RepID=A0ABY3SHQ6_9BACL|nr:(S)-benzoin forming benzil reductase [Paenibacillus sp. YPD9-1]UJF32731.1 (S)-benzoin forming benzil reductase [Paenibacillus sp. YPD9-1]
MSELYIVTGGSKGLGEALVRELLRQGADVCSVARTESEALRREAPHMKGRLAFHMHDLAQVESLDSLMERILSSADLDAADSITLISNAGMLEPMTSVGSMDSADLQRSLQVNVTAPMMLTSSFIRLTETLRIPRSVVHISSGAGKKPYPGWAAYCSAKAAIDMFTRCVAAEQEAAAGPNPVRICSVAPGVVDTGMQEMIRAATKEQFPQVDRFIQLKEQGQLQSAEDTAKQLLLLFRSGAFEQGEIADLRTKKPETPGV